jgi:hypothetical protein
MLSVPFANLFNSAASTAQACSQAYIQWMTEWPPGPLKLEMAPGASGFRCGLSQISHATLFQFTQAGVTYCSVCIAAGLWNMRKDHGDHHFRIMSFIDEDYKWEELLHAGLCS